jgi:hypothetical protein
MSEQPEKIKDLQYSFSGFLWKNLDKIQEAWLDQNDPLTALYRATSLTHYLPIPIKKELEPYVKQIQKDVNDSFSVNSTDFHTTQLTRNRAAMFKAQKYLPLFMNRMLNLLDQRGYLERGFYSPISKEDFAKLEGEPKSESNGNEETTQ